MSTNLKIENPYKKDGSYNFIPPHRQLGPGPSNSSSTVLNALASQPITFGNHHFYKLMDDIQKMTRYVYQTKNQYTVIGQFSGNGGNEAMVVNLADPGDTILVAVAGVWGMKVADYARRYNLNVIELNISLGDVYTVEELEKEIIKHKPVALFVTHGESSGGTLQPLEGLGKMCHKHNCLLAVDAVMSVGVAPLFVDEWEIDAVNGGTQKGIGAPSGMCLMSLSDRAYQRMTSKKHRTPYILDMHILGDMWACYGRQRKYLCTFNAQMLLSIRQALREICEEGLEKVWQRHKEVSEYFVKRATEELGMKHMIDTKHRFHGVCCVALPKDVKWPLLLEYSINNYALEFGPGIGPTAGKCLRISFLAQNAKKEVVDHFLNILKEGFQYIRTNKPDPNKCPITLLYRQWQNNLSGESLNFDEY